MASRWPRDGPNMAAFRAALWVALRIAPRIAFGSVFGVVLLCGLVRVPGCLGCYSLVTSYIRTSFILNFKRLVSASTKSYRTHSLTQASYAPKLHSPKF